MCGGFYASWCINRKVDGGLELPLKVVQARLGHASIQMTADTYGHLFPRRDDGAELAMAETALLGNWRMRLECGVGFRQLRTCRRIPPEAAMCQIQTLAPEKTHLLACLLAAEAFEAVELW